MSVLPSSDAPQVSLILAAKRRHEWAALKVPDVIRCWRGGCIIRAKLLSDFHAALVAKDDLDNDGDFNLLASHVVADMILPRHRKWRALVAFAVSNGVPVPALSASLAYFDSLRTRRLLSAALIQAQRDCFGGHTYRRLDKPEDEVFSSDWLPSASSSSSSDR